MPRPASSQPNPSPDHSGISELTDSLFRQESGKLVSILTGIFGTDRLQLAEDVVQEAMIRALQTWPYYGVPDNPAGWLLQTARNIALDALRREVRFGRKQTEIAEVIEGWNHDTTVESPRLSEEIRDDQLRLFFACCHPELPAESQTALALRTLCGFSPAEIASAFLTTESTIAKRLVRARQRIRDLKLPYEIPAGEALPPRLDAVLQTIYLLYNEGYMATSGDEPIRHDLCREAIRLATLLTQHPRLDLPGVHALLALMLLHAARFTTRTDEAGELLRLQDQDRSRWDKALIQQGMAELARAAQGTEISTYHLQAGIAAHHCMAPSFAQTNWHAILELYDQLVQINDSCVVALNRAVAISHVEGPAAGIRAAQVIARSNDLENYYLLSAVMADLEMQRGHFSAAASHFRRAIELARQPAEIHLLEKRLSHCEQATPSPSA